MRALAAIALALAVGGPLGQQTRDQQTRKPVVGAGAIVGRVVNAQTRQPIADALVGLIGGSVVRVGQTDAKGGFILPALPAGKFMVTAVKPPYLAALHGASRPGRPGTAVVLTDGQIVAGVEIEMWPGAVITGTVTDEQGEPVPDVEVHLQRARGSGGDQIAQTLAMLGGGPRHETDDRGMYRLHGVAPGDYLVVASVPQAVGRARRLADTDVAEALRAVREKPPAAGRAAPPPPAGAQSPMGRGGGEGPSYAPVYFSSTTDMTRATPVSVGAGEERAGINIRLEIVPLARVDGVVYAADGTPGVNVQITLQRLDESPLVAMLRLGGRAQTAADGQFSVRNVAPGQYRVFARGSTFWASTDVTIGGQDVTGLTLQLQPAMSVAGRVVIDRAASTAAPDLSSVVAIVAPMSGVGSQMGLLAGMVGGGPTVRADGSFDVGGLMAGNHVVMASVIGGGPNVMLAWRVGSVVVDGRDLTDLPFELKPGAIPKDVVITLTDVHQRLSGVIADASGRPLTASTVLLFATDRRYWYPQSRRVLAARPGSDGSYEFSGMLGPTAGEYYLSVVSDLEPDQQYDPAFLDALARASSLRFVLSPGEAKRQDLRAGR
jgi:5-hydroxyisourate hydrolase-like protein (transthyretin family)